MVETAPDIQLGLKAGRGGDRGPQAPPSPTRCRGHDDFEIAAQYERILDTPREDAYDVVGLTNQAKSSLPNRTNLPTADLSQGGSSLFLYVAAASRLEYHALARVESETYFLIIEHGFFRVRCLIECLFKYHISLPVSKARPVMRSADGEDRRAILPQG